MGEFAEDRINRMMDGRQSNGKSKQKEGTSMANENNLTQGDKERNVTIATVFEDARWGKTPNGDSSLITMRIDAQAFDALSKVGIGDRILIKRVDKKSSNGSKMAFLEIVKDRTPANRAAAKANNDNDI